MIDDGEEVMGPAKKFERNAMMNDDTPTLAC